MAEVKYTTTATLSKTLAMYTFCVLLFFFSFCSLRIILISLRKIYLEKGVARAIGLACETNPIPHPRARSTGKKDILYEFLLGNDWVRRNLFDPMQTTIPIEFSKIIQSKCEQWSFPLLQNNCPPEEPLSEIDIVTHKGSAHKQRRHGIHVSPRAPYRFLPPSFPSPRLRINHQPSRF